METGDRELLSVKKLTNAENWNIWKFQVTVLIKAQRAWEIVTGAKPLPAALAVGASDVLKKEYVKDVAEWQKLDAVAQKIVVTTISEQCMLHIINCNSAMEMWKKLEGIYEQKSESSIHALQQKWFTMTKDTSDDMATHIAKVENLAYRLQAAGEVISDKMIMTKIILTIPSNFKHFATAWESTPETERTKTNLIARLNIEEFRINQMEEGNGNALTSRTQRNKNNSYNNYNNARGSHRGRGFYRGRGSYRGRNQDSDQNSWKPGRCNKCNKPGHWARECRSTDDNNNQAAGTTQGSGLICEALVSMQKSGKVVEAWYLDSGATEHMTHNRCWYVSYQPLNEMVWVRIGDGTYLKAYGRGDINILAYDGKEWKKNHLSNVLYVPKLKYNLFSSGITLDKGLKSVSDKRYCKFYKNEDIVAVGERESTGVLYIMQFKVEIQKQEENYVRPNPTAVSAETGTLESWHQKFAHQNFARTKEILKSNNTKFREGDEPFSEACAIGKSHRLPFPISQSKTERIGEIIHADVCGPLQEKSMRGSRYFLLFKDDFSHYRHVYFVAAKSNVADCISDYIKKAEKHCPKGIKILRTDNGLEMVNKQVEEIITKHGIQHQRTVAYCPEQNGSAERENRTIIEAVRTILHAAGFEKRFWAEAVSTVVYVLNHTGTSSVKGISPYELWHNKKPNIKSLHIFGEKIFTHIPKQMRQKLDNTSNKAFFLGYDENAKGYRAWFPTENTVKIVRNVLFSGEIEPLNTLKPEDPILLELSQDHEQEADKNNASEIEENLIEEEEPDTPPNILEEDTPEEPPQQEIGINVQEEDDNQPTRNLRNRTSLKKPNRYSDYVDIDDVFIAESGEPLNYTEAVQGDDASKWKEAMQEEMEALNKNEVWKLVDKPEKQNVIENRWVFKIKRDSNGKILRYKERLVVCVCKRIQAKTRN